MVETNGIVPDADSVVPQPSSQEDPTAADLKHPSFSTNSQLDNGHSKRPRDARLIHLVLANYGVSAYQERVPLQLMDFAYRYTSSTLQDALHFVNEGYGTSGPGTGSGKAAAQYDMSSVTLSALRLSIASRTHYQFNPTLPKEFYNEIAQEKNRVGLPPVSKDWGMRLPPEQYCLTGAGWNLREEWDEEDEAMVDAAKEERMEDVDGEGAEDEDGGEEEGRGRMEDIFGDDRNAEMGGDMEQ
ncbi:MAG: Transcription initiation factor TFIID subunit 9 [Alectoria fallacina]|uniref:Transcription initiation factor TFIID subunit 9 n=1 Tax=Alectoria fallacina TaxID=1903189 RepID=A0A8H3G6F1_9LECA|nr:MAG: Transcription initiation factor TFIID subunit 9 [Alectoria fallacina]